MGSALNIEIKPFIVIAIAISIHSTGKNHKIPRNRNSSNNGGCKCTLSPWYNLIQPIHRKSRNA